MRLYEIYLKHICFAEMPSSSVTRTSGNVASEKPEEKVLFLFIFVLESKHNTHVDISVSFLFFESCAVDKRFTISLLHLQVDLGEGIMCNQYAYQNLSTVKEHSDWAIVLLTGVYGDKARNMRYKKPRNPELESFSLSFINVAKCKIYILYSVQ